MSDSAFLPLLSERELLQCLTAADSSKLGAVIDVIPETKTIRLYNRMWDHMLSEGNKKIPFYSVHQRVDDSSDFARMFPPDDVLPLMFVKKPSKKASRRSSDHKRRLSKREKKMMKRNRQRKPQNSLPPIDYLTNRSSIAFIGNCNVTMAWCVVVTEDANSVERLIAIDGVVMHVPKPQNENDCIAPVIDDNEERILEAFKSIIIASRQLINETIDPCSQQNDMSEEVERPE